MTTYCPCGQPLTIAGRGRAPRYCSGACRARASRNRRANRPEGARASAPVLSIVPPVSEAAGCDPTSLTAGHAEWDRLTMLVVLRDTLWAKIGDPATSPRDLAALTRRLQEIDKDIRAAAPSAGQQKGQRGGNVERRAFSPSAV